MMEIIDADRYYRIRHAWSQTLPKSLRVAVPGYDYAGDFRSWLASWDARIELDTENTLIRDLLDIAPGYDKIVLADTEQALIFLLKFT